MSLFGGSGLSSSSFSNVPADAVPCSFKLDNSTKASMSDVVGDGHSVQRQKKEFFIIKLANGSGKSTTNGKKEGTNGLINSLELPQPTIVLYDKHVNLSFPPNRNVGCGLNNLGNTCFLSATLQCLSHLPPWYNYIISDHHQNMCKLNRNDCMVCMFQRFLRISLRQHQMAIAPHEIVEKLKQINSHMQKGRQEDAHEFLLSLLNVMQNCLLSGHSTLDTYSQETTVLCQIFGGYLRSQITCRRCNNVSNTFEHFFDLSLDIKNVKSLIGALSAYVKVEVMDGENLYKCDKCRQSVAAEKRYSVEKSPNVLIIQLKRYSGDENRHIKLSHHICFSDTLDLTPFMSRTGPPLSQLYRLHCVLVHAGSSITSGHYFAYVCGLNNKWYQMNDERVNEVSFQDVQNAQAYMLFFVRKTPNNCQRVNNYQRTGNQPVRNSTLIKQTNTQPHVKNTAFTGNRNNQASALDCARASASTPVLNNGNHGYVNGYAHGKGVPRTKPEVPKTAIPGCSDSTGETKYRLLMTGTATNSGSKLVNVGGRTENGTRISAVEGTSRLDSSQADPRGVAFKQMESPSSNQEKGGRVKPLSINERVNVVFNISRPKERWTGTNINPASTSATTSSSNTKPPLLSLNQPKIVVNGNGILNNTQNGTGATLKLVDCDYDSSDPELDENAEPVSGQNSLLERLEEKKFAPSEKTETKNNATTAEKTTELNHRVNTTAATLVSSSCRRTFTSDDVCRRSTDLEINDDEVLRFDFGSMSRLKRSLSDSKIHSRSLGFDRYKSDLNDRNLKNNILTSSVEGGCASTSGKNDGTTSNKSREAFSDDELREKLNFNNVPPETSILVVADSSETATNYIGRRSTTPLGVSSGFTNEEGQSVSRKRRRSRDHSRRKNKRRKNRRDDGERKNNDENMKYVWVERTLETIKDKKNDGSTVEKLTDCKPCNTSSKDVTKSNQDARNAKSAVNRSRSRSSSHKNLPRRDSNRSRSPSRPPRRRSRPFRHRNRSRDFRRRRR